MKPSLLLILLLALPRVPACRNAERDVGPTAREAAAPATAEFRVETVAQSLEVPWSIAFTPDGGMLVTERPGRVRVIENGRLRPEPLARIDDVVARGEGGLMGMALHPGFAQNRWLYLGYTSRAGDVRVVRYREAEGGLTDRRVILDGIPSANVHVGMRLGFGPDGKLYVTTGDAAERGLAQRLDSLAGKTLRLNDDGSVPEDNPFVDRSGARSEIWSYGHRNAQGMDWQPGTGLMFQTKHGPSGFDGPGGGDEVNIVERGRNYGWPVISHRQTRQGMESPLLEYTPAVAPASGVFYRGEAFPAFRDSFFFGCLRGRRVIRVRLHGREVLGQESLLRDEYGRLREVAVGPDGLIYVSTSNRDGRGSPAAEDDRILRLVPAASAASLP